MAMDPVSIATLATKVVTSTAEVGFKLYQWIKDTEDVNDTVMRIYNSTVHLSMACSVTEKHMRKIENPSADELQLISLVELLLKDALKVMDKLIKSVDPVRKEYRNFVFQMFRQFRLDMNEREIRSCNETIEGYMSKLSVSLVLLCLNGVRPGHIRSRSSLRASTHLPIHDSMYMGLNSLSHVDADASSINSESTYLENAAADEHGKGLALEHCETVDQIIEESKDYLELTQELDTNKIHGWEVGRLTDFTLPNGVLARDSARSDPETAGVRGAMIDGCRAFNIGSYDEAQRHFNRAMTELRMLSGTGHHVETDGLQYKRALCAFHVQGETMAKADLLAMFNRTARSRTQAMESNHAGYILATTHIRNGDLIEACDICQEVYLRTRVLYGVSHDNCYEALALLSLCFRKRGDLTAAQGRMALIPQYEHNRILAKTCTNLYFPRRKVIQGGPVNNFLVSPPRKLRWSADNAYLAWQDSDYRVIVCITKSRMLEEVRSPEGRIDAFALSPFSGHLAMVVQNTSGLRKFQVIRQYDLKSCKYVQTYEPKKRISTIKEFAFSPNGEAAAYVEDSGVQLMFVLRNKQLQHDPLHVRATSNRGPPRFSSDGKEIGIHNSAGLLVHKTMSGHFLHYLQGPCGILLSKWALSADGMNAAAILDTNQILHIRLSATSRLPVEQNVYDLPPITQRYILQQDLAYLPNNRLVLARYVQDEYDWVFALYDPQVGQRTLLQREQPEYHGLLFSPDGTFLAAAAKSGNSVQIWDVWETLRRSARF